MDNAAKRTLARAGDTRFGLHYDGFSLHGGSNP
jgi:hypothetical protein